MQPPDDGSAETREATLEELSAVMGILDGAMLEIDVSRVRARIAEGRVLVAVADGRLLGAVVWIPRDDRRHVEAIAVRPGRRGQGIGTALVHEILDGTTGLTAEFDAAVRPFYAALGFELEAIVDGRYRGTLRE